MEQITFGLLKGIQCKFAKTEPEIIEAISKRTGVPVEQVKEMMRYNIFTVNQFSKLSQLTVSQVTNKTRPVLVDDVYNTELDFCYPFRDSENEGPKFIFRNEKSEKYLKA